MEDNNGQPTTVVSNESEGLQGVTPETNEGGSTETVEQLRKRYSDSSREGKANWERAVKAEAKAQALEEQLKTRSLTSEHNEQKPVQFPEEGQAIRSLVENGEFTEKQAKVIYEGHKTLWQDSQALRVQNQALANILKYNRDQQEKGLIALDPLAKEASEFFEGIPELEALPAAEKRDRYLKIQQKGVKTSGRDTTAAKMGAGGSVGGGSQTRNVSASQNSEELAKIAGFPSGAAFDAYSNVHTQSDQAAWEKKFNFKLK